jgi:predicted secreted protein
MADVTLSDADDGRRIAVGVGDTIALSLRDLASGGYRWTVTRLDREHLTLQDEGHTTAPAGVGAAGTAHWRFGATREGRTRLELTRSRPWEAEGKSTRFAVTIDITA